MTAVSQSDRSSKGPSAGKKMSALAGASQQGGPVSENPNSMKGKSSQLTAQRQSQGLDQAIDGADETTDKAEPSKSKPTTFVGKSGMVFTEGGTLNLRKGPDTASASIAKLPLGSPLECTVAKGVWLKVTAWPGGTATAGYVHSGYVKEQPGLDTPDKKGDTDDRTRYIYKKMEGKAFQGTPSVDDVKQGSLGDCYLITALGAIATTAKGQAHLKKMVTPHGQAKSYTVKFKKKSGDKVETVTKTVDTWFPTANGDLRYALKPSKTFNKPLKDISLWPAIVEKAYAAWQGSYDDIESGHAEEAIGEMTGLSSKETPLSDIPKDADLLAAIKGAIKRGEAVTASSLYKAPRDLSGQMSGSGLGPYTATGDSATALEKSVRIVDGNAKPTAPGVRDDGKGKLSSPPAGPASKKATGTVDYKKAKFSVTYPEASGPAADSDLDLTYKAKGKISTNPLVYGRHAYIVRGMKGDKLDLFNPWNSSHPGAVDIATFRSLFRKFTNSVMPDGTTK